jgi:hypothetical protein
VGLNLTTLSYLIIKTIYAIANDEHDLLPATHRTSRSHTHRYKTRAHDEALPFHPIHMQTLTPQLSSVDILILGAGWTSTFLIPLCQERAISYAATSRPAHPKPDTIPFAFDENDESPSEDQFAALPDAKTVLVTFPITVKGASERLVRTYEKTRTSGVGKGTARWIQLGSTGVWDVRRPYSKTVSTQDDLWTNTSI